jgi:hypothetical protein
MPVVLAAGVYVSSLTGDGPLFTGADDMDVIFTEGWICLRFETAFP